MSNKRKRKHYCSALGCHKQATVLLSFFDDDGTQRGTHWLCQAHAVEHARGFRGRVWGDAQCQCGNIDHIIEEAGVTKHGEL